MATPTSRTVPVARNEPRTRTALLLEAIALRQQIAVLERSRTWRPCFRRIDRLFWILLSRWWPPWRESLLIVQPETVLRWRRSGWLTLWTLVFPSLRNGPRYPSRLSRREAEIVVSMVIVRSKHRFATSRAEGKRLGRPIDSPAPHSTTSRPAWIDPSNRALSSGVISLFCPIPPMTLPMGTPACSRP
jgi:hypothetical protein